MFYSYILKSLKDGGYYYGSTSQPEERLKSHNHGKVCSTKGRRPLIIHYQEGYETKKEAIQRENYFKSIDGYNYLKSKHII